jgi:hypothetical protein
MKRKIVNDAPGRAVVDYSISRTNIGHIVTLQLSCGHFAAEKYSQGIPKRVRCEQCKNQSEAERKTRRCRICGCTDDHACVTKEGSCYWVEQDLCSACASKTQK